MANEIDDADAIGGSAVREVEAKDIDAARQQRLDRFLITAGGTERRDDLGSSHR